MQNSYSGSPHSTQARTGVSASPTASTSLRFPTVVSPTVPPQAGHASRNSRSGAAARAAVSASTRPLRAATAAVSATAWARDSHTSSPVSPGATSAVPSVLSSAPVSAASSAFSVPSVSSTAVRVTTTQSPSPSTRPSAGKGAAEAAAAASSASETPRRRRIPASHVRRTSPARNRSPDSSAATTSAAASRSRRAPPSTASSPASDPEVRPPSVRRPREVPPSDRRRETPSDRGRETPSSTLVPTAAAVRGTVQHRHRFSSIRAGSSSGADGRGHIAGTGAHDRFNLSLGGVARPELPIRPRAAGRDVDRRLSPSDRARATPPAGAAATWAVAPSRGRGRTRRSAPRRRVHGGPVGPDTS